MMRFVKIFIRKPSKRKVMPTKGNQQGVSAVGQVAKVQSRQSERSITSVRRRYLYLGQEYSVRLEPNSVERNGLKLDLDQRLMSVALSRSTVENFESYMQSWYRRRLRSEFERAVRRWRPHFEQRGLVLPSDIRLKVFDMRRAWGRCYYAKALITINLHLVKLPADCFDYIVLHEMCHFVHHNHSSAFKSLVASIYPEWKQCDDLMRRVIRERPTILQKLHI